MPSMFAYCTEVLHLSESEANLRIGAARASRKYPVILTMLADGRLHLSGIGKLAGHLDDENVHSVLSRAAHKTKRQIEELIAELAPKPDIPPSVRKLPTPVTRPVIVAAAPPELRPDGVETTSSPSPTHSTTRTTSPPRPTVAPLAPARYKVQFTASAELRDKLRRLQALMRSSFPDGDLAAILEEAVTEKLERLEAKRYGKVKAPRKSVELSNTSPGSRYRPAAVMRVVCERDGDRCTFVNANGRRCPETDALEFHHDDPYGKGGDFTPENVRLLCKTHNLLLAERDYGKRLMESYRRARSDSSAREPSPAFGPVRASGTVQLRPDGVEPRRPESSVHRAARSCPASTSTRGVS